MYVNKINKVIFDTIGQWFSKGGPRMHSRGPQSPVGHPVEVSKLFGCSLWQSKCLLESCNAFPHPLNILFILILGFSNKECRMHVRDVVVSIYVSKISMFPKHSASSKSQSITLQPASNGERWKR